MLWSILRPRVESSSEIVIIGMVCGVRAAASSWVEFIHCSIIISIHYYMIVYVSLLIVLYYLLFILMSSPQKHNVLQ